MKEISPYKRSLRHVRQGQHMVRMTRGTGFLDFAKTAGKIAAGVTIGVPLLGMAHVFAPMAIGHAVSAFNIATFGPAMLGLPPPSRQQQEQQAEQQTGTSQ